MKNIEITLVTQKSLIRKSKTVLLYSFIFIGLNFVSTIFMNQIIAQGVSIGETLDVPHNSAILDLQSVERGFLLPRMTTAERNNINDPALSLMIFNTTTNCLEIFVDTWHKLWCQQPDTMFFCGTSTVGFIYNGQEVIYGTVLGANGKCWLDRNLGASQVATSSTDELSFGDLFQWGRGMDGHQARTSNLTGTLSNSDTPGHIDFILGTNSPFDWRSPQNANLWQGVNGINNPCPTGWRLPTGVEWDEERLSWSSNDANGAFNSPLNLPLAGTRSYSNGTINFIGLLGSYWSHSEGVPETANIHRSLRITFDTNTAAMHNTYRANGLAVRCIKD